MIQQLRLSRNPWHCDCEVAYLAMWLRKMYFARNNHNINSNNHNTNDNNSNSNSNNNNNNTNSIAERNVNRSNFWQSGAGAICLGPGTLGGKLVIELTFHQLCDGQWASMRGLAPRLPVELLTPSPPKSAQ